MLEGLVRLQLELVRCQRFLEATGPFGRVVSLYREESEKLDRREDILGPVIWAATERSGLAGDIRFPPLADLQWSAFRRSVQIMKSALRGYDDEPIRVGRVDTSEDDAARG